MAFRSSAPENSRLFILAGKGVNEDVFREEFERFGKIEDLWVVKDRNTREEKGVVYITYSKTSEAVHALEEMNGQVIEGNPKPIKVMIANTKRDGSVRDPYEEEKILRLFVIIPKSWKEDDLRKEFDKFGEIDNVTILRERDTQKSKGFGFVKYNRAYHCALAFENCDRSFKPKFADPFKKSKTGDDDRYVRDSYRGSSSRYDRRSAPGGYPYDERDRDRGQKRGFDDHGSRDEPRRDRRDDFLAGDGRSLYTASSVSGGNSIELPMLPNPTRCQRLHITAPLGLNQHYINRLCDLIPGLEYCDFNEQTGVAYARYESAAAAAFAREKLDQFEYPIGSRLMVRYADSLQGGRDSLLGHPGAYGGPMDRPDIPLHQAARVLEKAGFNADQLLNTPIGGGGGTGGNVGMERVTYCNFPLPLPQPLVPEFTPVAEKLFIVCQPAAVPERILRDAFSRFGGLIDVYLLPGRNFGYAKYANKSSAMQAMDVLHAQTLADQRLKVLEYEQPNDDSSKRQRTDR